MFKITQGKGFQITFDNGWKISVQWGHTNYCSNSSASQSNMLDSFVRALGQTEDENIAAGARGSWDAETAVISPGGNLIEHPDYPGDTVQARLSPAQVLGLMNWTAKQERN